MKKFWFILPFLASCGIFKKTQPPPTTQTMWFQDIPYPALHTSLILDYIHSDKGEDFDLAYFPLSNHGYQFDYKFGDLTGSFATPEMLRISGNQYAFLNEGFENDESGKLMGWLSSRNFQEVRYTGKTVLGLGTDTAITFEFKGVSDYTVVLSDTNYAMKVVEMVGVEKPYYLSFAPDINYPLIVKLDMGIQQTLVGVQNTEPVYSDFEPGPGCVLQYRMIEAGVNEYEIRLQNFTWTSEEVKFNMSGTFASESYTYNFEYDVVYLGKALESPDFLTPVFSVIKGEKIEEANNWIFLRKNEISEIEKNKSAWLSVPHYADDPREIPDAYEDSSSYNEALHDFNESYHTQFYLDHLGRMEHTDFMYFDKDWDDNLLLGGLRLINQDLGMELIVLNKGQFPLLLYFNDGQMYEIFLEAAGKGVE
jgi:hypothetical protein